MCVRIVFVLVLCCVQTWAQRDPTLSRVFQDRDENPQGRPPPLDQLPVLSDISEHPYITTPPSPLEPMDMYYTLKHAGVPTNLSVVALPLEYSDRELQLNVSWLPSLGVPAKGYTVEVKSVTDTSDCKSQICYQPGILKFNTSGLVFEGDTLHWHLLLIPLELAHKVNLLAKVHLVDERGCLGAAGNATVSVPVEDAKLPSKSKLSFGVYAILGVVIVAFAMGAVCVLVKRVLKSFRPTPVSAPLEPLIRRPAWFSNNNYEK